MSTTTQVTVWCDALLPDGYRCGQWTYGLDGPHHTVKKAVDAAADEGWRRRMFPSEDTMRAKTTAFDLCPDHRSWVPPYARWTAQPSPS